MNDEKGELMRLAFLCLKMFYLASSRMMVP